jgi:hypothetical protein
MKREPVYEGDRVIGHDVHYPDAYMTLRDARGYESLVLATPAHVVFVPVESQPGMFGEDD